MKWGSVLAQDPSQTQSLEEFWATHQSKPNEHTSDPESPVNSPSVDKVQRRDEKHQVNGQPRPRGRGLSTVSAMPPGLALSPDHPARSLPDFLDTFGPLIFPIYKAALLRKRILLVGQAPVELTCNFGKPPTLARISIADLFTSLRHLNSVRDSILYFRFITLRATSYAPPTSLLRGCS